MDIKTSKKKFVMASVAGLLAMSAVAGSAVNAHAESTAAITENCSGINACKGMGDCGGKGHACAGKNTCKGEGWLKVPAGLCGKIQGGKLVS